MALTEVVETIFQENLKKQQNNPEEEVGAFIQDRSTSTKDKVVLFQTVFGQNTKPKKDYSWFYLPRKLFRNTQEIKTNFDEAMEKSCKASTAFKACFQNYAIGALFRNEKKLGAIISKSKL